MKIHIHITQMIIALIISLASPLLLAVTTPEIFSVLAESASTEDKKAQANALLTIATHKYRQGLFKEALKTWQQELPIRREIGDKAGEGVTLNNIGEVYRNLAEYPKALDYLQQALAIHRSIDNKSMEGITLNNIGNVYWNLGEYPKALDYLQQALTIAKQIGDKPMEGTTINSIGLVYKKLGEYPKALKYYQQALAIRKQVGDKAGEGVTLNNIAGIYNSLEEYSKALDYYKGALAIAKQIGHKQIEGVTLNNIAGIYESLEEYVKALDYYQQALIIARQIDDKAGEANRLNNIGFTLESQNQLELAIVFYKQSVNIYETIRQNLKVLPKEQQESYTETVADTYRNLADLLLKQNRILEAQRVLDLLKVQELDNYLTNVRGNQKTSSGIPLLSQEEKVARQLAAIQGKEIELGKELTKLQQLCSAKCTSAQENRKEEIYQLQQLIRQEYNAFIKGDEVKALIRQLNQTAQEQNLRLANLNRLSDNLQKDAVLLYPLILEDRLELILVTPNSPPIRRTATVKREDLNRTILEFRSALQNPNTNTKNPANTLYQWLIKPIENDLKQAETKTIIYAPDSTLRYIPLAALHDGEKWLIERFATHNITAASLDDLDTKRQTNHRVLAAAFSQGNYSFKLGSQQFNFTGLPFAGIEVENLVQTIANTTKLINQTFSAKTTISQMRKHSIVHLATHAAFVVGKPEDSFILFGNGDRVTLREVEKWYLPNVDLIVLSACETGVGDKFGNGEEILGFGYLMQQAGAKAAIASLWQVSDGGTQALMDAFYAALQNPKTSKADALRKAQIALINGNFSILGNQRASITVQQRIDKNLSKKVSNNLSHPYYWAPFILIGNGL
ncbi:MAG: CHAT domain-containing protein [Nostocales cyanobacterium 94392]|nr:CHAT domain-containing protein [Nostocales cyanobacterium 94392]